MACKHKFQHELHLEQLTYEPTTLIVGTFNPQWPEAIPCDWFYGRTAGNYCWDVLPRLYGQPSLIEATQADWKQFCKDKQIAITDIISAIDDANPANKEHVKLFTGLSDKAIAYNFDDFEFVDIVQLLQRHPSIKNVYFSRGVTEAFWKHLWNPVAQYCSRNGLRERKLLSPTTEADYSHEAYNRDHAAGQPLSIQDYILMRWKEEWHF